MLLPFERTYNDYGGGEDSLGIGFDLIMAGLTKIENPNDDEQGFNYAIF